VVLIATVTAVAGNLATSTVQVQQPWWPFVTWGLVALLIVVAVRVEVRTRRSEDAEAGGLDRMLNWLAVQIREQWEHEAVLRHLYDPVPLRVCWSSTRRPVAADRVLVLDDQTGGDWESLPVRGHAEEIVQAFLKLPHERLVVLGEPGAGKSVLAVLLTLGLLQLREAMESEDQKRTPVPVLVSISSWDPQAEHLQAFLARRLGEDYPPLSRAGDGEPSVGAALIAKRRLFPILDGLDELSRQSHAQAVSELNAYAGVDRGLVVTCRSHEYEQAVKTAGKELARAAVVELQPVLVEQAIEFLSQPALARPRWQPVFDYLRGHPDGDLATVLSTPLMIALARAAYSAPTTDPRELLAFRNSYAIEAALMDGFVRSAYPSDRPDPPVKQPLRRYAPDRASRWLGCLAHQCHPDWQWWNMRDDLLVRPQRVELMIITGAILVLVGVGVAVGLPVAVAVAMLAVTNISGLWRPLWPRSFPPYRSFSPSYDRLRLRRVAFAATGATAAGLVLSAPLFGLTLGLITGGVAVALPTRLERRRVGGIQTYRAWPDNGNRPAWATVRRVNPRATLRANHRMAAGAAVLYALLGALSGLLTAAIVPGTLNVPVAVLVTAIVFGGNAGLGAGWRTWTRYRLVHMSLAARGFLPWRLWRFVEDAHLRGVLRQSGTSWQFRHVRLEVRLEIPLLVDHLRARADVGDRNALKRLLNLLEAQDRSEESIAPLRRYADAGDDSAASALASLLARHGHLDELRRRADAGDDGAPWALASVLAQQGEVDELRVRANAGDWGASWWLADLLAQNGQVDELRARLEAGHGPPGWVVADRLSDHGQMRGAISLLRPFADAGEDWAAGRLARILARQSRTEK
jgi:hypothetical protein